MDNKMFDKLPPKVQLAYMLGTASRMFGRPMVQKLYDNMRPLVDNAFGHGKPLDPRVPGETDDPRDNYWQGVWRIYQAE